MNTEKLQRLLDAYIEMLPKTYSQDNREYVKWSAVLQFQKSLNIDAADFASMFKLAVSKTDMLINNRMVQPTAGIVRLAERPECRETIRSMFRALFADDCENLMNRQHRIEQFALQINEMLAEYEPGKWKYRQDFRSVLAYLNLYQPGKNYLLKSSQAYQFKYCVEYGDDFGSGSQFSLKKYYRMCDEIREAIAVHPRLTLKHAECLKNCSEQIVDAEQLCDDNHLLTFDVIFCTSVYQLYLTAGLSVIKPQKHGTGKAVNHNVIEEELREAIQDGETKLCELHGKRSQLDDFSLIGLYVSHSLFGRGMIASQDQMRITVQFADKERIMMLPDAFTNTNLKTDDPMIPKIMREICQLDRQIELVKHEVVDAQKKLQKITEK